MAKKNEKPAQPPSAPKAKPESSSSASTPPPPPLALQTHSWFDASKRTAHLILIFLLSCLVYVNTIGHTFAVDDSIVILRNTFTKKGLKGMHGIWTEDTFVGFFGKQEQLVAGGRYRPFSVATFALENELFGEVLADQEGKPILDADGDENYISNPHISHVINILLYGWLCVIIYLMLLNLFKIKGEEGSRAYFISFVATLLYALHPIHTEAVANIKGRDEILVGIGSLLALHWTVRAIHEPSKKIPLMLGASLMFIMGIFSKENAITFLAIIPVSVYLFSPEDKQLALRKAAIYTLPYLLITLIFWFGIRRPILGPDTGPPPIELMNDPFLKLEKGAYVKFTTAEWLATCLYSWLQYLRLLVLPHPLTNDYYPKHIHLIPSNQQAFVMVSAVLHIGMAIWAVLGLIRRNPLAWALIFYAATFSVISNLFFPIGTVMAERFLFLPSLGFTFVLAWYLWAWVERQSGKGVALSKALIAPMVVVGILALSYSAKTFTRNFAWTDDFTLFTTDIAISKESAKLNNAVSGVLQDSALRIADEAKREEYFAKARQHALKAISLHPTYNQAHLLLGNACIFLGGIKGGDRLKQHEEALALFDEGIKAYTEVKRLRPDHPDVERNLGVALRDKGKLLGERMGRLQEAIMALEESNKYNDKDVETLRLLGVANGVANRHEQAMRYLEKAAEVAPMNVAILYNLEVAYKIQGQTAATGGDNARANEFITKAQDMNRRWMAIDSTYNPSKKVETPQE